MEFVGGSGGRRVRLQGPKPAELAVSKESAKIKKKARVTTTSRSAAPVIVYLRSPKVIHVRPEEFMDVVQRLTGKNDQTAKGAALLSDVSPSSSLLWLSSPSPSSSIEYFCR
ncbi:protein MKS1-like [Rhodamnia argentea]|uniref:Protein MKS1-like n=1 Tax=Rhodamnia argentea TaxID=178133 RepID=A0A8B8PAR2_9MYRT|nr:protein MKS1-like [Rhodamnia argentea]